MHQIIFLLAVALCSLSLNADTLKQSEPQNAIESHKITKVFGSSPPMTYLIYALNPEKIVGLNFKAKNPNNYANEEFLDKNFLSLPVIGTFHGGGQSINIETLFTYKPELVLLWADDILVSKVEKEMQKTKIPTVTIPFRKVEDIPAAFTIAGDAMQESERGALLSAYAQKVIQEIQEKIKDTQPTRYYYAEGIDGLSTECDDSFHVEAMNFAGGKNVHSCHQSGVLGMEKITFETLLSYDPEAIIVQNRLVYNEIMENPLWKHLRAYKNKNIHLVPNMPFNWIDRPPSFMRLIGVQWLANIFHPKEYTVDFDTRLKEFYKLYLGVTLTQTQRNKIVGTTDEK
ncbi:MAG: ABC transporter substrate-binding protein [Sulfurimonas sp.]|nr:ABC transporter substrate-binding protein [Sulfurimonas sp.]